MSDEDRYAREKEFARLRAKKYRDNKRLEVINERRDLSHTLSAPNRPENLNESQFNESNVEDEHHVTEMESEIIHLNMDHFDMSESSFESPNKPRTSDTFSCSFRNEDEIEELDPDVRKASMDEDELEDCFEIEETNEIEELRQWALSGNPTIPHTPINS